MDFDRGVVIVSGYEAPLLFPFGQSMKEILANSFNDLGIKNKHIYYSDNKKINASDSLVVFLMQPEKYYSAKESVIGTNNKCIFWSVEPVGFDGDGYAWGPKSEKRLEIFRDIMDDGYVDLFLTHQEEIVKLFDSEKCIFMPIGYHECLQSKQKAKKITRRTIVFVGFWTSFRKKFYSVVLSKWRKMRFGMVKIKKFGYNIFRSPKLLTNEISRYCVALDIHSTKNGVCNIRWHRIMLYCGAGLVLITNTDLKKYGFVKGVDYIHFNSCEDFAAIINDLDYARMIDLRTGRSFNEMVDNMRGKIMKKFYMPDLLKGVLEKIK